MPPRKRLTNKEIPPFEGDGIILDTTIVDEIESSYLEYSYSVIYSRALPDARDGLKPVHRRILYSMYDAGLRPDRAHVKSARVVGDCFAAGTLVRTPLGLKEIEKLNVDDEVRTPAGKTARVVATYANPPGPAVEVTFRDGRRVTCTPDQLFRVVTDDLDIVWTPARTLAGHRVVSGLTWSERTLPRTAYRHCDDATSRYAYVQGLMVAEGFPAHRDRANDHRVRISMVDPEPITYVECWARDEGLRVTRTQKQPSREHHQVQHCLDIARHDDLVAMLAPHSKDKIVPASVLEDEEQWLPFLAGFLDGDGYVRKTRREIVLTTTSVQLQQGLLALLHGLGVSPYIWTARVHDQQPELAVAVSGDHAALLAGALRRWVSIPYKRRALEAIVLPPKRHIGAARDRLPVRRVMSELARASQGSGWVDKLERIGSPLTATLNSLSGFTFDLVTSVVQTAEQSSFDISINDDDHAFDVLGASVHNCMGKYHPHGDMAIYDALVRLAQPFSMRVPLVDGHGNFGSPDDSPAAARYTEARLSLAAMTLVEGLGEETVDFEPNYDGSEQQPSVLPAAYPNLLVNGTAGIAVGMATNMIPHNLIEVVDAARHLLEHPSADLDDLMRIVPGPDLPTGGQLLGMEEVRQAYETGRGVVRMRATAEVGPLARGKSAITVTELPYGVGAERVIAKVKELVNGKRLQGIADVKDLTDRSVGTNLVFEIKAGFNPQAVLGELYRLTPLEESFGINNLALVDGQPRTLGLKQMLEVFLDHRRDVITRRSRYRLRKAQERAHLVEGLLLALANIDEVVRIIRSSPDVAMARESLMDRFGFTDVQAGFVLDMQLRRLVALEVEKLETELTELRATIAGLLEILNDPEVLKRVLGDELAAVAQEHGTPRRTVLVGGDLKALVTRRASDLEVADAPCDVLLSSTGLLARTPVHAGETQPGGRRHRHDVITATARTTTRGHLGLLTTAGRMVRVGVLDIPEVPAVTTGAISLRGGASAAEFLSLERGERVVGLAAIRDDGPGLALATRQGVVKRVAPEAWPTRSESVEVISLKPGDEVVGAVELVDGQEELVLFASTGDLLRFPAESVRPQGRAAGGMAGMRLDTGAFLVGFSAVCLSGGDTLFEEPVVVTAGGLPPEKGKGVGVSSSIKVTPLSEYPRKGRATGGVRCQRLLSGEALLVLGWAGTTPWAASANGDPVELPPAIGKRDGSGAPSDRPIAVVGQPHIS